MRHVLLLLAMLPIVSCATIATGTRENIVIASSPSPADAKIVCDGVIEGEGVTPVTINLRRGAGDCLLEISKDGYETSAIRLERGINPAYWLNTAFTPFIPLAFLLGFSGDGDEQLLGAGVIAGSAAIFFTDFRTGAARRHEPANVNAVLKPK